VEAGVPPIVIAGHRDLDQGVLGLLASRLAEKYYRPAVVYEEGEEFSVGSARSIPEFDVTEALRQCASVFERFGGHHQAGGFKIRTERLPEMRQILTGFAAARLPWESVRPTLTVDLELPLAQTPPRVLNLLRQLEPCGQDNSAPLFLSRGLSVRRADRVGDRSHLRMHVAGSVGRAWSGIGFGLGEHCPPVGSRIDLVYAIEPDRDGRGVDLKIKDFALAD
jgi:single-stranded-DNA-specific exonuclease